MLKALKGFGCKIYKENIVTDAYEKPIFIFAVSKCEGL